MLDEEELLNILESYNDPSTVSSTYSDFESEHKECSSIWSRIIMSKSDESPPLSLSILPSIRPKKKIKRKISKSGRSTQTKNHYICYVKSEKDDYTAFISMLVSRFFNQSLEDPRNEHFGTLIAFEIESVPYEIRSQVYMDIINLIYNARKELHILDQGPCPSPEY